MSLGLSRYGRARQGFHRGFLVALGAWGGGWAAARWSMMAATNVVIVLG